jgi:D-inositol-3-phosphate glycosyltransferase
MATVHCFPVAKILYCGDIGVQTGFGRVAEYLVPALAKEHEVHALAVNWHGDPSPMQQHCFMYPAQAHGSDPFGSHRIASMVQQLKPDLVFIVNDIWVAISLYDQIEGLRKDIPFKSCIYTPIDSYGLFPELLPAVEKWDQLITYTHFGAAEIALMGYNRPVPVIGHGTDFSKFFPMDKSACRKALSLPEDAFIVFNGNRNQPRKRIDLTIKGFIEFAVDKPDARLWLHMGVKDMGWEIVPLFRRVARDMGYDPTGKLILSGMHFSTANCFPIEKLNEVYNAVDVGVNTCIGEGWGLVNTEHAATGVAQLVPDHTSLKEIFTNTPRITCNATETDRNYGLERMLPDPHHLAALLNGYYHDRDRLAADGAWCKQRIESPEFTWPVIQQAMLSVVDDLLAPPPPAVQEFKGFGQPPALQDAVKVA